MNSLLQSISSVLSTFGIQNSALLSVAGLTALTHLLMSWTKEIIPDASNVILFILAFVYSLLGVAFALAVSNQFSINNLIGFSGLIFSVSQMTYLGYSHIKNAITSPNQ